MPNRILRTEILTSEKVDKLDPPSEVFYRRLMSVVDDYGLYDARPMVLKSALFPLKGSTIREADIPRWIAACEKAGLIALYEVDGKPYLILHKLGEPRAKTTKYPAPPAELFPHLARICAQAHASVPPSPSYSPTPSPPPKPPKGGRSRSGVGLDSEAALTHLKAREEQKCQATKQMKSTG